MPAAVDSVVHSVRLVVTQPPAAASASPLLLTLLGGILATGSGLATELFRNWLTRHRLRRRLAQEIRLLTSLLDALRLEVESASERVRKLHEEVNTARSGYNRIAAAVGAVLEPELVHRVHTWYGELKWVQEGVMGAASSLEMVRNRNDPGSEAVQLQVEGLRQRAPEIDHLITEGHRLLSVL